MLNGVAFSNPLHFVEFLASNWLHVGFSLQSVHVDSNSMNFTIYFSNLCHFHVMPAILWYLA